MDEDEDDNEEDGQEVDHRNKAKTRVVCMHYSQTHLKTLREAMCFVVASKSGNKFCYFHYPQRFDGIGRPNRYSNGSVVFFGPRNSTKLYDHCRYR
ncbi:unnamed protein product [Brassica rapa subsp. trilocularis]